MCIRDRGQVTQLLVNGKIVTTEAKAKEVRKIAEGLIALAVKEKDNFEEVTDVYKRQILYHISLQEIYSVQTSRTEQSLVRRQRLTSVSYTHLARSSCIRRQG